MKKGIKEYEIYLSEQKRLHKEEQQLLKKQLHKHKFPPHTSAPATASTTITTAIKADPTTNNKSTPVVSKRRRMAIESDSESDIADAAGAMQSSNGTAIKTESTTSGNNLNNTGVTTSDVTSSPHSNTHTNSHTHTNTNTADSSTETMDLCSDHEQSNPVTEPTTINTTIKTEPTTTHLAKEHLATLFQQTILSPKEEAELANYQRRVDIRDAQLAALDLLSLPGNPLDVIIDSVGGPSQVAEMTGRKSRLVRDDSTGKEAPFALYDNSFISLHKCS